VQKLLMQDCCSNWYNFICNEQSFDTSWIRTTAAISIGVRITSLSESFIILKRGNRPLTLTHHWAPSTVVTRETVVKVVFTRSWNSQKCTHRIVYLFIRSTYIYKIDSMIKSRYPFFLKTNLPKLFLSI